MSDTTIQVRVSSHLKEKVENIFEQMGLRTSEAIRMFLQQTINDEALPFQPSIKPNRATLKAFKEVQQGKYIDSNLAEFKKSLEI